MERNLLIGYRRATNIVEIEIRKKEFVPSIDVDPNEFNEPEEHTLFNSLGQVAHIVRTSYR